MFRLGILLALWVPLWSACQDFAPTSPTPTAQEYTRLRNVLTAVYERDQQVRNIDFELIRTDSVAARAFSAQLHATDSLNQAIVLPLLARYGWLPRQAIGEQAADALFLVVQHSDLAIMRRFLPQLQEQARRGQASAPDAATMQDRVLMLEGKKQVYGTQASNNVRPHQQRIVVVWPIQAPDKVNSLRRQVGFTSTVQQNADRLGAQYDPAEQLPQKSPSQ
ncbi:DUF6624 domain-containing protein [Hymenobacter mucosus]|uniref:Fasciclin domain-containing protein n=1 Tax=Hymenobacter mucosus TaxID=1411120 RepID=A0A239BDF2_9BACT|nr:DUF6624 domain-containing protein [Hymenobacter mucosus]SNS06035.1 hypothetical protein SAMN06269173_1226 [Hymenobacter mucosus]